VAGPRVLIEERVMCKRVAGSDVLAVEAMGADVQGYGLLGFGSHSQDVEAYMLARREQLLAEAECARLTALVQPRPSAPPPGESPREAARETLDSGPAAAARLGVS
jgi:hypothetical protein